MAGGCKAIRILRVASGSQGVAVCTRRPSIEKALRGFSHQATGVRIEAPTDHSSNQRNALRHVDRSSLARLRDQPKADLLVDLDKQLARDTADKRFGETFPDLDARVLK